MTDLELLKEAIVAGLVKTVPLPLASDALAKILYGKIVDQVWSHLPAQVQGAIGHAAHCVSSEQAASVLKSLVLNLNRILPAWLPWLEPHEQATVIQSVAKTFMDMSAENVTAHTFGQVAIPPGSGLAGKTKA